MEQIFKLSHEFSETLDEIENGGDHLFITGKAGTGKSTLLDLFRRSTSKNIAILAPTGIAALRVNGQTIHSFFKLPPRLVLPGDINIKPGIVRLCKKLEILIIDEISMVRADVLDGIDRMLRLHRQNPNPFGGVRIVLFGDIYQLPPIVSSIEEKKYFQTVYETPYFFSSFVWKELENIQFINLQKVYRQTDRNFINLLDEIRSGDVDYDSLIDLNERSEADFDEDQGYIYLSPRNATMQRINQSKLDALESPERAYLGNITGEYNPAYMPTEQILKLKNGAQVMFIKNDLEKQYVNGSIGTILDMEPNNIKVRIEVSGKEVNVSKTTWDMVRYKENDNSIKPEVVGTYEQFPLKLAWAMSIHKSQGQTFDKVILDMEGGAFEFGQTYVALSRCRTLEGIVLKRPLRMRDIMVDERVVDFYMNHFR
ncbi:MAG: AAA family ATPase [Saprospiraceae bacterium]|jgi:ATP-dependent DNA helicase PIF1|uniref:ATP-dependent DNA helicase n=1 Tax=Candidatus Brachybacter algidus TaxID=2982024 RepID=UPI001B51D7AF|nr:AAA family ATPase [Candidatus Brachybacter algidus]MBP7306797.1 AAA family ATPase [Saprospiraceae bacterium]MBK6373022.1 AAA family ATPase [Candidatus Brachybacter algidus]MBK6447677.1 AAA family ATPase [Candidatus Brachybacter algidus]MBK7602484.1 AAA family ATPase [Candidatus Brachybacter algidus]MBK8844316.1 AAA family ATPase [Candidatus Brachybacter algidus]